MAGVNDAAEEGPPSPITISFRHDGVNAEEGRYFFVKRMQPSQQEEVRCTITNNSREVVRFDSYSHVFRSTVMGIEFEDTHNVRNGGFYILHPQGSYGIKIKLLPIDQPDSASVQIRLRCNFCIGEVSETIVKFLLCNVIIPQQENDLTVLRAELREKMSEYSIPNDDDANLTIIWLDDPVANRDEDGNRQGLDMIIPLGDYEVPKNISLLVNNPWQQWPIEFIIQDLDLHLRGWENYNSFFHSLLYLEELQVEKDVKSYTLQRAVMYRTNHFTPGRSTRRNFKVTVPGLLEKRPSVLKGDRIFAKPLVPKPLYKYEGQVVYIAQKKVTFEFHEQFDDDIREIIDDTKFKIEFRFNRIPIRLMHRAIDMATRDDNLQQFLFPTAHIAANHMEEREELNIEFCNEKIRRNAEQKRAVEHIVRGTSGKAPYIIYGPPGTGKTFTLVEAIKQIYRGDADAHILVCAPTNHAADLVTLGLLEDVPQPAMLRINAVSRPPEQCDERIAAISTHRDEVDRAVIITKSIVVSTLTTSGWLVTGDIMNHFTHIFIDEAGFATEPETLIPLALLSLHSSPPGQVVLAGDPQQLGPVIRSPIAKQCGLGVSLLERLMKKQDGPYRPDANNYYNPNYVTKLVRSFRSHPDILKIPNEQFYNNELVACADVTAREMFCEWNSLPKKAIATRFPLIFHGVEGREEQLPDSPSWFNNFEAVCVVKYVRKLLGQGRNPNIEPGQIGIITPYFRQAKQIRKIVHDLDYPNVKEIKVGSVEKFQGDEREVIIISTVRCENSSIARAHDQIGLGFVAEPKRFNVAVTRAKALLIVVGNPIALVADTNWRKLIVWIMQKGGYRGNQNENKIREALHAVAPDDHAQPEVVEGAYHEYIDDEFAAME